MPIDTNSTCLISGAGRGIGFELTRQLLAAGTNVIATVRNPKSAPDLTGLQDEFTEKLRIETLDVTTESSVRSLAERLEGTRIDTLINNAGVLLDTEEKLDSLTIAGIDQQWTTNTLGPVRVTQALLPNLRLSPQPLVANISSLMGSITDNGSGRAYGYRMSKAALNMFTKCLANDEPDFLVVCLHPGWVQTQMGGSQAPVTPRDSAKGLLTVLRRLQPNQSGGFFDFRGQSLPW